MNTSYLIKNQSKACNCGPVAIINLMNHFGAKQKEFPLSNILELMKFAKRWDKPQNDVHKQGMYNMELVEIAALLGLNLKRKRIKSTKCLYSLIKQNPIGIVCLTWITPKGDSGDHFCTILGMTEKNLKAPNMSKRYQMYTPKALIEYWWKNTPKRSNWTYFYL